jgi:hypothetical protein
MTVSNGAPANQTTFNNAFVSRTQNTNTVGKVDLENVQPESGASVLNAQENINSLNAYTGRPANSAHDATPVWTNNDVGASSNTLKQRAEALTAEFPARFDTATGHDHDGVNSRPISATNLTNINQFFAVYQTLEVDGANGTVYDVSTEFTGRTPGGAASTEGVLTSPPENKIAILSKSTRTNIEDAEGQRVYARITEDGLGVWELSFFTNEAGTETAHSLATQDIVILFRQVFNQNNRPTIPADVGIFESLDLTADIVDASPTQSGKVNTGIQNFGGHKIFQHDVDVEGTLTLFTGLNGFLKATSGVVSSQTDVDLTADVSGILPVANGGTGASTAQGFTDAASPLTTKGDVVTHDGTNTVRLGVGIDGQILQADSAAPNGIKWGDAAAGGLEVSTFAFAHTDLSGSAPSEQHIAFTPSSVATILMNIAIKTTTAFNDGATLDIVVGGDVVLANFDLTQAVGATQFATVFVGQIPEWSTSWDITIDVKSGSSDTSNITQGALTVYTSYSEVI